MNATLTSQGALDEMQRAFAQPGAAAIAALLPRLEASHPRSPLTHFARAEVARRSGDFRGAVLPSAAALSAALGRTDTGRQLPLHEVFQAIVNAPRAKVPALLPFLEQLGEVMERAGLMRDARPHLEALVAPLLQPAAQARLEDRHAQAILAVLGFRSVADEAWSTAIFESLVLPWMRASAQAGRLDLALMLEILAYNGHTKRRESRDWFVATAGRWLAPLADDARLHRPATVHDNWRPEARRRIGFVVYTASMLAHVMVLVETLEAVHRVGARDFDFTVLVLGGRNETLHARLTACGVTVAYMDPATTVGIHERIRRMQQALKDGNFLACVWISGVPGMAVAFAQRSAPLQVWWAMKYHVADIPEIDARMGLENVVPTKLLEGHEWRTIGNSSREWLVPGRSDQARALRARYPADKVVTACVGREEKLDSPAFLDAVCELLRRHPEMIFLWTGRERRASIQSHFERAGVAARTEFVGWVDTKLYAEAVDVFLDSFPFPCGFSLKEAMAAGKPAIMMRTHESLETGVPGALSPVARGETRLAPAVDARLRGIFTDRADFDLYLCAEDPAGYVEMASRAITDVAWRKRVGDANRAYIEAFVSSPEDEAVKFLDHLEALCAPFAR